jgi:23S rRNA (uridine2552-2'-O)-methyltransferase
VTKRARRPRSGSSRRDNPYRQADAHAKAARAEGYAARSVYKLEEIDRRIRLLKHGQRVLDLGASPGSWSQYACKRIGAKGCLVAIDLKPLKQALPAFAHVLQGDGLAPNPSISERGPYDVVLSDMAPNTTGDKGTDKLRSAELFRGAAQIASEQLRPGGSFVGKLFMSGELDAIRNELREVFKKVRIMRPKAVRDVSYEIFLVGIERKEPTESSA